MTSAGDLSAQRSSCTPSSSGRPASQGRFIQAYFARRPARRRQCRRGIFRAFLSEPQDSADGVSTCKRQCRDFFPWLAGSVSMIEAASIVTPPPSCAAESLNVEFLSSFLSNIEHLGPYGPLFYVAVMIGAEMVPLFPTQPLTIASGLLFGGPKGALLALISTSSAAMLAFQLSRLLGEKIAEQAAAEEISEEQRNSGIFTRVQHAVESGSFQQQLVAVTLLRLTPVVPFSATNYLLGATPLTFPAYIAGSLVGLTFWCSIYATLGAAGRELLKGGLSLDALYDELLSRAGSYTEDAAIIMGVIGICVGLYVKVNPRTTASEAESDSREGERT